MAQQPRTQVEAEGRRGGRGQIALGPAGLLGVALLGVALSACSQTPGQKAEADVRQIRKESDAKTLVERGRAFAFVGDHTRAEEYLASAIEAGADPRDVLPLLMNVCVQTGRYRSAIQHAENHLRKHPSDLRTHVMVGALYAAIEAPKDARAHLEVVVGKTLPAGDRAPGSPPPPAASASVSPPSAKNATALRDRSPGAAVGSEGLQAHAHYLLGVVARDLEHDVVEADRHFREYLQIEPNGTHAEEVKGSLLKRVGEAAAATATATATGTAPAPPTTTTTTTLPIRREQEGNTP